jgi:hypothetical protein
LARAIRSHDAELSTDLDAIAHPERGFFYFRSLLATTSAG